MKKETFTKAIEAIENQMKFDIKTGEILNEVFPDANPADLVPDNHFLLDALLKVLKVEMDDNYEESWIEWFCFETNFGKENRLQAYDENGQVFELKNAEDLYNFLKSRKKNNYKNLKNNNYEKN